MPKKALSAFEKAFAAARRAGKESFTHAGKKYTTDMATPSKNIPVPTPRPATETAPKAKMELGGNRSRFSPITQMSEAAKSPANRPVQMKALRAKAKPATETPAKKPRLSSKKARLKK